MCGDPNSVLRFAFVEFTDEGTCFFLLEHSVTVAWSHHSLLRTKAHSSYLMTSRGCPSSVEPCRYHAGILPCPSLTIEDGYRTCESNLSASGKVSLRVVLSQLNDARKLIISFFFIEVL